MSRETHTPQQTMRIDADLWERFGKLVGKKRRSTVVREFISWYVGDTRSMPKRPKPPA